MPPWEQGVYPDVGGDNDKEREEEYLTVVGGVVDIRPMGSAVIIAFCHNFFKRVVWNIVDKLGNYKAHCSLRLPLIALKLPPD